MSNEVLVGIDGSDDSVAALRWATRFAVSTGRPLVLAYASQRGRPLEGPSSITTDDTERWEADVVESLRDLAAREGADGDAGYRALRGPAVESLLHEAARIGAGLIVVGASGRGAARRALLGSVSRELTSLPSHAIAVVPKEDSAAAARRFVVGVDGSDGSSRALRWTADAARRADLEVVAVHAFEPAVSDPSRAETASLEDERRQRFEEEWCAPLRAAGVPYRTVLDRGDGRAALRRAAESEEPVAIVVGSRGLGVISERLLGSVTHDLVRELPCPSVVIPSARDRVVWPPGPDP